MPKLIVLRGVPGSGKSLYAKAYAEERDAIRLNRDDIKLSMFGRLHNVDNSVVDKIEDQQLRAALSTGQDILSDNTNLRASTVKAIVDIAIKHGYDVAFQDFPIDMKTAIERDANRKTPVGAEVIRGFFDRYHIDKTRGTLPKVPVNQHEVNRDFIAAPYIPDTSLPKAFGVDLDGTLAQHVARGPHDTSLYHTDAIDESILTITNSLFDQGHKIVIFTGRSEDFRKVCEAWLHDNGVEYHELVMRPSGDTRNDSIVKAELFDRHIAPKYNFIAQFDDRDRVVDMFRARGIKCLQVQPGNF